MARKKNVTVLAPILPAQDKALLRWSGAELKAAAEKKNALGTRAKNELARRAANKLAKKSNAEAVG